MRSAICHGSARGSTSGSSWADGRGEPAAGGRGAGQHGLFTWGDTAKACYEQTLHIINKAAVWLDANVKRPVFGGAKVAPLPDADAWRRRGG